MKTFCAALLLLAAAFATVVHAAEPSTPGNERIERLAALGKLWGEVKYFHPALAYRSDIDWDAALVRAIPKVTAARDPEEYAAALDDMLRVLGDPLTRVDRQAPSSGPGNKGGAQQLDYRLTGEGYLIVTAGDYFALYGSEAQQKLRKLRDEIKNARVLIIDLRTAQPGGDYGNGALRASFAPIERLATSLTIETPGERGRLHRGYDDNSAFSSGQYKSGFFAEDGNRIAPARGARDIPTVTLLNRNSGLLASTLPLQAAGKGLIVFEGEAGDSSAGKAHSLDMGENLTAHIRISELIFSDGTSAEIQPDLNVRQGASGNDEAMEAALKLAKSFKPSSAVRKKLPATALQASDKSYPEMKYPALENRLLAAFRIWNIINYFHPYKELTGEDWESVLRDFIPRFMNAKDALEYNLTVAEMATRIHDSHSYVAGDVINDHFGTAYLPIRVRLIEDALVLTHFYDEALAKAAGLEIGDLIVNVDGEDARARLARYAKYISASTLHNKMDKATFSFMNGADKSVAKLLVRNSRGQEKEVLLTRKHQDFTTLYHRERSGDILRLLPGNVGYADLDRMTVGMIDEMLEKFKNTRAIIFDMRGYPHGVFWFLAPRLSTAQGVQAALLETPLISPFSPPGAREAAYQLIQPSPQGKATYKGKTVMLIDERTISQAEHTGLFFRAANNTRFVGSPTAGANGEIAIFSVPGGVTIGFSGQAVKFPNGTRLQRIGLVPDLTVTPTISGIRAGRDEVLDAAIKFISK